MSAPRFHGYTPLKVLTPNELEILIRLLREKLDAKTINVPQSRLLLRAVATRAAAGDRAAVRIRQTVHRVKKQQAIQ